MKRFIECCFRKMGKTDGKNTFVSKKFHNCGFPKKKEKKRGNRKTVL
jgi:hypothetical protein